MEMADGFEHLVNDCDGVTLRDRPVGDEAPVEEGTARRSIASSMSVLAGGLLGFLVLATDDWDAAFERIQASGAEAIQKKPMDQAYGVRGCAFRDPAGDHIRISQPRG